MKTYRYLLLLLPVLFFFSACHDENEKGNLKIQLNGYVGSQPLSFTNTIYNDGSREFFFSKFKLYLSHIKLVKEDNSEVEVKDIAYFDYSADAWKSVLVSADAGTYKGLKFWVGLDPTQNSSDPNDYDASEPLGDKDGDMHWSWLKYRFVVLEGIADTLGNGFGGGNTTLGYHVGRDQCYREVALNSTGFTINADGEKVINLNVDLLNVFQGTGAINMFTEPGTQSEDGDLPVAVKFADRFAQSFSYSE